MELGEDIGPSVTRSLFDTLWEHIEDEGLCEETSWESLGKRFCGKKLGPRVVTLQDCVLGAS